MGLQRDVENIVSEIKALPAELSKELDLRSAERTENLRSETLLRLQPLEQRVSRLEKVLWATISFVFMAVGSGVLALVLSPKV